MSSEFKKKTLTHCFAHDNSKVLLGLKNRGFGAGRGNGFGGKLQEQANNVIVVSMGQHEIAFIDHAPANAAVQFLK